MDEMNNSVQSENNFNTVNNSVDNISTGNEQMQNNDFISINPVASEVEQPVVAIQTVDVLNSTDNNVNIELSNGNENIQSDSLVIPNVEVIENNQMQNSESLNVSNGGVNSEIVSNEQTLSEGVVMDNNTVSMQNPDLFAGNATDINNNVENTNLNNIGPINTVNNVSNVNPVNTVEPKKKKNNALFIVIGLVIIMLFLIAGIALLGYKSYVNKPKNLYTGVINILYKELSDTLNSSDNFDLSKNSLAVSGDLKLSSSMDELKDYTNYTYNFGYGIDVKNKKMELSAAIKDDTKNIIGLMAYCLDDVIYIDMPEVYDKLLYFESEEDIWSEIGTENLTIDYGKIDKLAEKMSQYLINALDEDKFKEESATVKVNGKDVKVTKVIYPITNDTLYDMVSSIFYDIKNDDEFIDIYTELLGFDKDDKDDFVESLNDLVIEKSDFSLDADCEFYLYTTGFFSKVVGFGFYSAGIDEMVQHGDLYRNEYFPKIDLSYIVIGENGALSFYTDEVEVVATIKGTKTEGTIKVEKEEVAKFTLNYVENDNDTTLDSSVTMNIEDVKIVLDCKFNSKKENSKKTKLWYEINVKAENEGETIDLGAKYNLVVEIDGKVADNVKTEGAVDVYTLTDADSEQMLVNLENALKDTFIYDLLFMYSEPDYDDDYWDDDYYEDDYDDDYWYDDEYEYEF